MSTKTKKKQAEVTFRSRSPNQRVVLRPRRPETRDTNNRIITRAESGKSIQFEQGTYVTDDPGEIEALRNDPQFGNGYGWVEETPEPTDVLEEITNATAAGSSDVIEAIKAREEQGYQRPQVIAQADSALNALATARGSEPVTVEDEKPKRKKAAKKKAAAKSEGKAEADKTAEADATQDDDGDSGSSAD